MALISHIKTLAFRVSRGGDFALMFHVNNLAFREEDTML